MLLRRHDGVVLDSGIDAGVPWHFGDPMREQRVLEQGEGVVDLSHRGVITVTGPDRLGWLHSLTTQHLERLEPGRGVTALVLSPQGHSSTRCTGWTTARPSGRTPSPAPRRPLAAWLDRMRFLMRVEVADRTRCLRGGLDRRRPRR